MLRLLHIRNLAVVEDVVVEFTEGLNLLTGETGSGKSILVDGLALLFGTRGSGDLVRTGEALARIEGNFEIDGNEEIEGFLDGRGLEYSGDLILRREISSAGRSRNFLNDYPVSAGLLKDLRPYLLEIHGQGDQLTLLDPETHLDLLDRYGELLSLRADVEALYRDFIYQKGMYDELTRSESDRLREIDSLDFQASEIAAVNPSPVEDEELRSERGLLINRERLCSLAKDVFLLLYDDDSSALSQIGKASRSLAELSIMDPQFESSSAQLESLKNQLKDLADAVRDYPGRFDLAPGRLEEVENRLAVLERLKRKYGPSLTDAIRFLDRAQTRLDSLKAAEISRDETAKAVEAARESFLKRANELSAKRVRAARRFEEHIARELRELALEHCRLELRVETLSEQADEAGYRMSGMDRSQILISTNLGEDLRPLAAIASGGELSRIMLAIKTLFTPSRYPRSMVFDEIDAGIGGRVSEVVGRRLKRLAGSNQVLCVTHQAQIARFADAHFVVTKQRVRSRTKTIVDRVEGDSRVGELARMLGGATITPTTRKHAKELLAGSE